MDVIAVAHDAGGGVDCDGLLVLLLLLLAGWRELCGFIGDSSGRLGGSRG